MVPIHESDVAEGRWLKGEWENYELWEKVEVRLKRQKRLWIIVTALVFLALSAVPIVLDRGPKWMTRIYARKLAQEINHLKRDAGVEHSAFRVSFADAEQLELKVERVLNCSELHGIFVRSIDFGPKRPATEGASVSSETLLRKNPLPSEKQYVFISPETGRALGVPGLLRSYCYDDLKGSDAFLKGENLVGFGIIPAQDLTERRMDRMTVLLLSGANGEMAFD